MHVLWAILVTAIVIVGAVVGLTVAQIALEELDSWISRHKRVQQVVTALLIALALVGCSVIVYGVYEWISGLVG